MRSASFARFPPLFVELAFCLFAPFKSSLRGAIADPNWHAVGFRTALLRAILQTALHAGCSSHAGEVTG